MVTDHPANMLSSLARPILISPAAHHEPSKHPEASVGPSV
jgi:hypothetical protein